MASLRMRKGSWHKKALLVQGCFGIGRVVVVGIVSRLMVMIGPDYSQGASVHSSPTLQLIAFCKLAVSRVGMAA